MGAAAALAAGAAMAAVPLSGDVIDVATGTVLHGDVYAAGRTVEVSGRIEGDLFAAMQAANEIGRLRVPLATRLAVLVGLRRV